jgi:hypothetical protein
MFNTDIQPRNMQKQLLTFLCFLCSVTTFAQYTQRIRGTVVDKEARYPLAGVTVAVTDVAGAAGTATNENGDFVIENIPVGKHTLQISYMGYEPQTLGNILVTSGKEVLLQIELTELARKMDEVTISARKDHINEMALISAKTFDVQETERYAGSRADPARMASNFAGVQGADDSRNDIIIRGNSPSGLLWRMEEVDIPNPNHFAVPGTSGGPVSMLNNKVLGNSDFFTGAFPAEYGNSIAGAFDLKFRNGNSNRHEFSAQLGFLGTELSGEGPLSKKSGASYLFAYRYSTLKLFESFNFKIGTSSVPIYQDLSFKLNFPFGKKANLSFFGIGGLSNIDLIVSNQTEPPTELYGESDRDQYFTSNTGVVGASFSYTLNPTTYTKITIAQTGNNINANHYKVFRNAAYEVDSLKHILDYTTITNSTVAHWYINKKLSARQTLKAGIVNNLYELDMTDSSRQYPPTKQAWDQRQNYKGTTNLAQAYLQYKYRPTDAMTITAGLHGQYLSHNQSTAIEPRIGMRYKLTSIDALSIGYGLHSQVQPLYQYFAHLPSQPATALHNYDMGFTRSHHIVAGYEHAFKGLRLRSEAYYQYLFNVPIEKRVGSSFSLLNQGGNFSRLFPDTLVNDGTGYNYGLELTIEKPFSRGYYILFTASVFDSKAKGNDGVYRSTDYNGQFATNLLAGYEYKTGKNTTLITGVKITYAGGKLYSPPDVPASQALGDLVVIDSLRNTLRFPDYFRADVKLGLRINRPRVTHEIALDLVNILGIKNLLSLTYNPDLAAQSVAYPFNKNYQLGFLPLFYYKVDFGIKAKNVK